MRKCVSLWLLLLTLASGPASGDPRILVDYRNDILRVTLDGSFAGSTYRVSRANALETQFAQLSDQSALCTGDCFVTDLTAVPGKTYLCRFDLDTPSGAAVTYGPYAVTVPNAPLAARISPNPFHAGARVDLALPGSRRLDAPLRSEARVLDLQGRTVRTLYRGLLARGITSIAWDGHADSGRRLDAGVYFLRVSTPLGNSTVRIVRAR